MDVGNLEPSPERLMGMLRRMVEIRLFEEMVERLYREGRIAGPTHLYVGQEAVAVGVCEALVEGDQVVSTYRGHGHAIARGVPPSMLLAEILGRATGTCRGLGGSMHASMSTAHGIPVATAIVGSGLPIGVGMALALSYMKTGRVVAAFFGDGAVNTGAFHEALNLAAIWRLPILFVCENNQYAMSTPIRRVLAGESITARAAAYGIRAQQVFGNDVVEVHRVARALVEQLRKGEGPAFMECLTYRFKGHGAYDVVTWYRPRDEVEAWLARDPIALLKKRLIEQGLLTEEQYRQMEAEVQGRLEEARAEALEAPVLEYEQLGQLVYAGDGDG
jgi:2-oxoisovalerate dehydrogenase E1 component